MAVPFDIASFNLISMADNIVALGSSNPATLSIPQKDENGNLITVNMYNRGWWMQKIWDDVGAAVGQLMKTFYLDTDPAVGNDLNPGTAAEPFLSVKKALQAAAPGAYVTIYLKKDQVYQMPTDVKNFICNYERIQFASYGDGLTPAKLKWSWIEDGGEAYLAGGIDFKGSLVLTTVGVQWYTDDKTSLLPSSYYCPLRRDFIHADVIFFGDTSESHYIGDGVDMTQFVSHGAGGLGCYMTSFVTSGGVDHGHLVNIVAGACKVSMSALSTVDGQQLSADYIKGLVLDPNGVPRNLITNIVL